MPQCLLMTTKVIESCVQSKRFPLFETSHHETISRFRSLFRRLFQVLCIPAYHERSHYDQTAQMFGSLTESLKSIGIC